VPPRPARKLAQRSLRRLRTFHDRAVVDDLKFEGQGAGRQVRRDFAAPAPGPRGRGQEGIPEVPEDNPFYEFFKRLPPEFRGQHIGERLLVGLIDAGVERGARWMTLEVRKSNLTAQALYRKYGFREIGTRKGYYSDNREDAIVMWTGNLRERDFQARLADLRKDFSGE